MTDEQLIKLIEFATALQRTKARITLEGGMTVAHVDAQQVLDAFKSQNPGT